MKGVLLVLILLLAGPAWAAPPPQDAPGLERVLAGLEQAAAGVETLAADFVQEKRLEIFAEVLTSRGRFYFQRPDRLRWEVTEPVASGFALEGGKGRRWHERAGDAEEFAVSREPGMRLVAEQLLAWARVDLAWLAERYRIALLAEAPVTLELTPLATGARDYVDHLRIVFAADRRHVQSVEFFAGDGDVTRIRFVEAVVNGPLPAGLF
ncbi:MAG: outer membrane lipoprotein carrier protein LolA [Desulfuromonas sp.]|uniref:LolA family protein n=1 Tax=Desulfuromonas sp. TaxID=892 RepID=UPI000CAAA4B2|nr:outer membrane lipoprotein carrier protein LolA [Desulfuromonas sp.]PLX82979.1 MAG: outer membrane lipoprotein carrier protein LolA [Desulfuromonas sp.]